MSRFRFGPPCFDEILSANRDTLLELGCRCWNAAEDDERDGWPHPGMQLMLFPGEWFWAIPEGFSLCSITGREFKFDRQETNDDTRCGMLAFGVLRPHKTES